MTFSVVNRMALPILFSIVFYTQAQAQLSFGVEKTQNWKFKGSSTDQWPDLLGQGDDFIITRCVRLKSFRGFVPSIEKRSISTGELLYKVDIKNDEFRDLDMIYEDVYFENGNVHLLYRTEKEDKDSLYLLDRMITPDGQLQEARVLIAGWLEDKDNSPTMRFSWNETRTGLSAIGLKKNTKGEALYIRRRFNDQLQLVGSDTYKVGSPMENVRIIEYKELKGAGYLFTYITEDNSGKAEISCLDEQGIKTIKAGVKHRNISGLQIHSQGEDIHLSYLSFENQDRKNITGYHSSIIHFRNGQQWVTNYTFSKKFLDHIDNFDSWAHKDRGRFSIKQIIEHPQGGYIATLHKTYSLETSNSYMVSYYSNDHVLIYINQKNEVGWTRFIPSRMSTVTPSQINNFTGFTRGGKFVEFIANNPDNTEDWNAGNTKARLSDQTAITAAIISPNGEITFKNIYKDKSGLIVPATSNMSRITAGSRDYYMFKIISGSDLQLVKVTIDGLVLNGYDPVYDVLQYGRQK